MDGVHNCSPLPYGRGSVVTVRSIDGEIIISPDDRLRVETLNDFGNALNELEVRLCSGTTARTANPNDSSSCRVRSPCQTWWWIFSN